MRPRNYAIVLITCLVAAMLLWTHWSGRDVREDAAAEATPGASETAVQSGLETLTPSVTGETKGSEPPAPQAMPAVAEAQKTSALPKEITAFADKPDADPVLSRELDYQVQTAIRSTLDTNRFEVLSLKCRGNECQIALVDNKPGVEQSALGVIGKILMEVDKAPMLNPSTGESLQPDIQLLRQYRSDPASVVAHLSFQSRKR